jgi:hypothetical protein
MKKTIQTLMIFLSFQATFGQADLEQNLINTLNSYEKSKNEDSYKFVPNLDSRQECEKFCF